MTKLVGQTSLRKIQTEVHQWGAPIQEKNSQGFGEVFALPLLVRIMITLLFVLAVNLKWVMVTM
jgi:hypothetical protein